VHVEKVFNVLVSWGSYSSGIIKDIFTTFLLAVLSWIVAMAISNIKEGIERGANCP